jgi:hypothetical protein
MTQWERLRTQTDAFFRSHPQSPLTSAQQRTFRGLHYFPENAALRFELTVEPFPSQNEIAMHTSTGDERTYTRYGRFKFTVDGHAAALTIYADAHGFFLPVVDALAGTETYGAGRYLEPQQGEDGRLLIDFNLAYHPYCAYNDVWSCPLTPWENRLQVPIRAGEKLFSQDAV